MEDSSLHNKDNNCVSDMADDMDENVSAIRNNQLIMREYLYTSESSRRGNGSVAFSSDMESRHDGQQPRITTTQQPGACLDTNEPRITTT